MTSLSPQAIADLFGSIENRIAVLGGAKSTYLRNLEPAEGELERLEWRYRLAGYLEGLFASGLLEQGFVEHTVSNLFARPTDAPGERPSRRLPFSIDIVAEQRKVFNFDVPAINPLDAYVQLTRRTAFKTIPGMILIRVFEGFLANREADAAPLRTFHPSEFIFTS